MSIAGAGSTMKILWKTCIGLASIWAFMLLTTQSSFAQTLDDSIKKIAGELAVQAKNNGASNLAIAGFSELNGYESAMTDYIAEELVTAFFAGGAFNIVERRELERVMAEQAQYSTDLFNPETIAGFGELLGVDAIVTGSVTRMGGGVRLNARVINVETGRVFGASAATVSRDPFVEALLDQPRASAASRVLVPGQVAQPSDVVFRNRYMLVTPSSVVLSSDRSSVTVTASIKNISNNPILVGYNTSMQSARAMLTASGVELRVPQPSGIGSSRYKFEISPQATTLVRWVGHAPGGVNITGQTLNLRDKWEVQAGAQPITVFVNLNGLRLE